MRSREEAAAMVESSKKLMLRMMEAGLDEPEDKGQIFESVGMTPSVAAGVVMALLDKAGIEVCGEVVGLVQDCLLMGIALERMRIKEKAKCQTAT